MENKHSYLVEILSDALVNHAVSDDGKNLKDYVEDYTKEKSRINNNRTRSKDNDFLVRFSVICRLIYRTNRLLMKLLHYPTPKLKSIILDETYDFNPSVIKNAITSALKKYGDDGNYAAGIVNSNLYYNYYRSDADGFLKIIEEIRNEDKQFDANGVKSQIVDILSKNTQFKQGIRNAIGIFKDELTSLFSKHLIANIDKDSELIMNNLNVFKDDKLTISILQESIKQVLSDTNTEDESVSQMFWGKGLAHTLKEIADKTNVIKETNHPDKLRFEDTLYHDVIYRDHSSAYRSLPIGMDEDKYFNFIERFNKMSLTQSSFAPTVDFDDLRLTKFSYKSDGVSRSKQIRLPNDFYANLNIPNGPNNIKLYKEKKFFWTEGTFGIYVVKVVYLPLKNFEQVLKFTLFSPVAGVVKNNELKHINDIVITNYFGKSIELISIQDYFDEYLLDEL